jgi:hypothetical protein
VEAWWANSVKQLRSRSLLDRSGRNRLILTTSGRLLAEELLLGSSRSGVACPVSDPDVPPDDAAGASRGGLVTGASASAREPLMTSPSDSGDEFVLSPGRKKAQAERRKTARRVADPIDLVSPPLFRHKPSLELSGSDDGLNRITPVGNGWDQNSSLNSFEISLENPWGGVVDLTQPVSMRNFIFEQDQLRSLGESRGSFIKSPGERVRSSPEAATGPAGDSVHQNSLLFAESSAAARPSSQTRPEPPWTQASPLSSAAPAIDQPADFSRLEHGILSGSRKDVVGPQRKTLKERVMELRREAGSAAFSGPFAGPAGGANGIPWSLSAEDLIIDQSEPGVLHFNGAGFHSFRSSSPIITHAADLSDNHTSEQACDERTPRPVNLYSGWEQDYDVLLLVDVR